MNVKSDCHNILIYNQFNVKIKLKIQAYKPKYHKLIKDVCCNHTVKTILQAMGYLHAKEYRPLL